MTRELALGTMVVAAMTVVWAQAGQNGQTATPLTFAEWLDGVRAEAIARGIPDAVVVEALAGIEEPEPVVIERDRTQAETVQTLERYLRARVTPRMRRTGNTMWARYHTLLDRVSARYGVAPRTIVAVWGFESNFGQFSGVRPTIAALATLAWDARRPALFRRELFSALEILQRGDIELARMRGSWAGAMGQTQFMPSSYLAFAEDFDGDGRRDIWSSQADVFASIANYLAAHGWHDGERWGREVVVPRDALHRVNEVPRRDGTCLATRGMSVPRSLSDWQAMGVRLPGGRSLPTSSSLEASLVSGDSRRFLVYRNYDALLDYNCAHSYAIGVGLLSDALQAPR
jgi:membrane-bound lytic murein transglycosylase B